MQGLKFYIETYGCQMNISDSAYLKDILINKGLRESDSLENADIIFVNTCSVRRSAEERLEGRLAYYSQIKKNNNLKIFVIGCYAQKEKDNIKKRFPAVDFVVGTRNITKISKIINAPLNEYIFTDMETPEYIEPSIDPFNKYRGFVSIIRGCSNFCSYCIVPYTRGPEYSLNSKKIIDDIKKLVDKGIKEVFLLGQNVNSYGLDTGDIKFYQLLEKINNIDGVKRIRFLTSHPKDFSNELIEAIASLDKVVKQVHLPLQSASDKVLSMMNRKYNYKHYFSIVENLRKRLPMISITTDILVGFPGEDEKDFLETYDAVKEIEFDKAFMFMYSPREGTASYNLEETLSIDEKKERLKKIIEIQNKITVEKLKRFIGTFSSVFIENINKKNNGVFGITDYGLNIILKDFNLQQGQITNVKIESLSGHTLIGKDIKL
ncbi:MAG TPA: tRNA (N6-isopentenyl adenosine(37)-C2)-methylthiotransferase MiaB [Spirochaetota bacterium]|nr:tRNA (N6-isopentenyl adenosine(37)-C2)-methylthiotransferase MiaB [Spirochaetota bacterium]HOM37619.1 tRNA (N6-isopentenyl adenosine(37)-C2)-methylthiotransferase MiaB [Spirochaetota bacterium]